MGFFLPACVTGLSDFDPRRALRALALFWLGFVVLRAMDTLPRRQGSSNRNQARHNISASRRIGSPRRRIAYRGWARSFQAVHAAAAQNEGLRRQMAGREGQDRREGSHRLSKIHERLSEKGTRLSGRRL